MTLSDIKLGIAEALKTAYPEFDIYTEYLEQGFTDRCFFIERIGSQKSEILCFSDIERYEQTHNFSITCFCDDSKTKLDELSAAFIIPCPRLQQVMLSCEVYL